MHKIIAAVLIAGIAFIGPSIADAAEVKPTEDAASLYMRAEALIKADSPAATSMEYRDFPPFPKNWTRVAEEAWSADGPVRELARQARSVNKAVWPEGKDFSYLNKLRNLANNLADACLYEGVQHHSAAAIELARDEFHLAQMVEEKPSKNIVRILVGTGIMASVSNRLMVIAPDLKLTKEENGADLNIRKAHDLIADLLDQRKPTEQLIEVMGPEGTGGWKDPTLDINRLFLTLNRANAERTYTAMSLACQLYRSDKKTWPASLEQLVPDYLPRVPVDPWGDGKQTFGYALIKGGLPDGSDRPLVYSREAAEPGLAYRLDEPQYGFYAGDGSNTPTGRKWRGGQFRDVARWEPVGIAQGQPHTKALP